MEIPVLLITFNRPNHTRRVLAEILQQEPQSLYVCQDGAREGNENDKIKCQEVRNVVNELTLAYKASHGHFTLHTLYQTENLGCGPGPAAGISWFFENVEQGIILEDDCLPHPDFFKYCEELLERYKENEKIGFIGGCNYITTNTGTSYVFSGGHHQTWGWATWRRSWQNFDYTLQTISTHDFEMILNEYCVSWRQREYWWTIYKMVKKDQMNNSCWDYQFLFSCWKAHLFAIAPTVNLVTNIGDGNDATHTQSSSDTLLHQQIYPILPLTHPKEVMLDKTIDFQVMKNHVAPYDYGDIGIKRRIYLVNRYIKRIIGHQGPWIKRKR